MTTRVSADSTGSAEAVWALLAQPARWRQWAPHIRGAVGLGDPEVVAGRRGFVRVLGVILLPARIDQVSAGRAWSWTVGPVKLRHEVVAHPGGSSVIMILDAPAAIEVAYAPLVRLFTRRLATVAGRG